MQARTTVNYLEGSLQWPYIFDKRDRYDHFSVAVVLAGDQIKQAKKLGLKLKHDPEKYDGLPYVQLRSNHKPDLWNEDDEPYEGPTMICNGSKGSGATTNLTCGTRTTSRTKARP